MHLIRGLHNLLAIAQGRGGAASASAAVSGQTVQQLLAKGCVATIGNFDGVHLGHQVIIRQLKACAAARGLPSVVMVFEPQPREYFADQDAPPRLMLFRQKFEALQAQGIDLLVCLQFNRRLRDLTGLAFIEQVLHQGLGVRHLVVGDDFRFGCDRSGDYHLLEQAGAQLGFSVEHTHTIEIDRQRVSSSRIRELLAQNQLAAAADLLGRAYQIRGRVVYGRQVGRQLGVPTLNLRLGDKTPPLAGVFVVTVDCSQGRYAGVANIGYRPTLGGKLPSLEVHLFDFSGDLYGERVTVQFDHYLREERQFASVAQLREQILADLAQARELRLDKM